MRFRKQECTPFTLESLRPLSEFKRMLASTFLFRCPYCVCGELYLGIYSLHDRCQVCGARFERDGGEWTGAVVIAFTFGILIGLGIWFLLLANQMDFKGVEYVVGAIITPITLLLYRPIKGWWIWLLYRCGLVYPDAPESEYVPLFTIEDFPP